MGTEAIWIPLAIGALSAGASIAETKRTERKQDNVLAAQLRGQGERQREADAQVADLISKTEQSTSADERAGTLAQYMDRVRLQKGTAGSGLQQAGAVSDAYKRSENDAALGISDYGAKIAGLLSRMDAPALQRMNEARDVGRFATEVDRIKRFAGGDDFLARLKLQGIKRNPWVDGLAQMGMGYATAGAGSWGSAAPAAAGATGGTAFGYSSYN